MVEHRCYATPVGACFARTLRSVVDATGQRVSAHDRLRLAEDIPTLIVWGADDAIIPNQHAGDAQATLPNCRVEIFERVGHFPHCEDPGRFVRVLTDFVESTEPAALNDEHSLVRSPERRRRHRFATAVDRLTLFVNSARHPHSVAGAEVLSRGMHEVRSPRELR